MEEIKYYSCEIRELNGEQEYDHKFLLKSDKIEKDFKKLCVRWFEEDNTEGPDELNLIWCYDGRSVDYGKSYFQEIPETEFIVASKYISDLSYIME
jgi:hypothetical protein